MSQHFPTRRLLLKQGTATLHGTVILEWQSQVSFALHLFCVIAASVIARNVVNQQVLDQAGAQSLGPLYALVALLSGVLLAIAGALLQKRSGRGAFVFVHVVIANLFTACALIPASRYELTLAKYVLVESAAALLLLVFGLQMGARFAPREARSAAARVGAGGVLGGLLGGAILNLGAPLIGSRWLFCVAAILVFIPTLSLIKFNRRIAPPSPPKARDSDSPQLKSLKSYGIWVCFVTILMVATTTLIDYQFRSAATQWFDADELTAFFGFVVVLAGGITLVFQFALLNSVLDRLGLFGTASIMPVGLLFGTLAFALSPSLLALVVLKLVDSGANMSVQQATGGLLLAPLTPDSRAVWQSRIDGLAKRGGQAVVGILLALFTWQSRELAAITLALCGLWISAVAVTKLRYIRLLSEILHTRRGESHIFRAYDGETLRLLESELAQASLARAGVILDLLAQAGQSAEAKSLSRLSNESPEGALLAIEHLARCRDLATLNDFTLHENLSVATNALLALAELDPIATQRACRQLSATPDRHASLQALAQSLMSDYDPGALQQIQALAKSTDAETRLAIAHGLNHAPLSAPPALAELIAELSSDQDTEVADTALAALARHPSQKACDVALLALRNPRLQKSAMRALAHMGAPIAPQVAAALNQELRDEKRASSLLWVLGRLDTPLVIPALLSGLASKQIKIRWAAATALNSFKHRRADLRIAPDKVALFFLPEIEAYAKLRSQARADFPKNAAGRLLKNTLKSRAQMSLETLFRLFALVYPESTIQGAYLALSSRGKEKRQLALELLDTLLEAPVRQALRRVESQRQIKTLLDGVSVAHALAGDPDSFVAALSATMVSGQGSSLKTEVKIMSQALVEEVLELQSVTLFAHASGEDLSELSNLLVDQHIRSGQVIFKEGDAADALYIISEGRVRLSTDGRQLDMLGAGDALGMVALLDHEPREYTATADSDCHLRMLSADNFMQLLGDHPTLTHSVFHALAQSLRGQTERLKLEKKSNAA